MNAHSIEAALIVTNSLLSRFHYYTAYAVGARGRPGTLWVSPSQPSILAGVGLIRGRHLPKTINSGAAGYPSPTGYPVSLHTTRWGRGVRPPRKSVIETNAASPASNIALSETILHSALAAPERHMPGHQQALGGDDNQVEGDPDQARHHNRRPRLAQL
jgi:hypothetical protein